MPDGVWSVVALKLSAIWSASRPRAARPRRRRSRGWRPGGLFRDPLDHTRRPAAPARVRSDPGVRAGCRGASSHSGRTADPTPRSTRCTSPCSRRTRDNGLGTDRSSRTCARAPAPWEGAGLTRSPSRRSSQSMRPQSSPASRRSRADRPFTPLRLFRLRNALPVARVRAEGHRWRAPGDASLAYIACTSPLSPVTSPACTSRTTRARGRRDGASRPRKGPAGSAKSD